jgi:hypothetical protein
VNFKHAIFGIIFLGLLLLVLANAAFSHTAATGWAYDQQCCSGYDCEALPVGAVEDTAQGWHVRYWAKLGFAVDVIVPYSKERDSQDGKFHGCATVDRFLCLYVPRTV